MNKQEAIKYMEDEIMCMKRATLNICKINCGECDLLKENGLLIEAYELAIQALQEME